MNNKKLLFIGLFMLFISTLFAKSENIFYGKINFLIGDVTIKKASGQTFKAKLNTKIYVGDKILTGNNGTAQVIIGKNIKIRIAKNSEFELKKEQITKANTKKTIFGLTFGKIWVNILKLKKGNNVEVDTPTAVIGVRGTIFVIKQDDVSTVLYVGKGEVSILSKLSKKEIIVGKGFMVKIDSTGKFSEKKGMTEQDKKEMMRGIPVFIKKGERRPHDIKKELKSEIRKEKSRLYKQRQFASRLRNEDLSTGRTLKDIHGNTVRVEQIFRKRDKQSFQILNITKRDDGLAYFDFTAYFNKELPKDFKNWGEFFVNNDNLKMEKRNIIFGTKKANGGGDTFRWFGTYNSKTGEFDDEFYINNEKRYGDIDNIKTMESYSDKLQLVGELQLYSDEAMTTPAEKIEISIFVISDDGKILGKKYFETTDNILTLFNTASGEIILDSDAFIEGEIDIVTIPNIGFVILQEIL